MSFGPVAISRRLCYFEARAMPPKQTPSSAHGPPQGRARPRQRRGPRHRPHLGPRVLADLGIPIDLIAGSSIGAVIAGVNAVGRLALQAGPRHHEEGRLSQALRPRPLALGALRRQDGPWCSSPATFPQGRPHRGPSRAPGDRRLRYRHRPVRSCFRKGNLLEAIRASVSIPGIFTPARFGRSLLVDGGVVDPLPIDVATIMGADLTIAVSLHPASEGSA